MESVVGKGNDDPVAEEGCTCNGDQPVQDSKSTS